MNYETMKSTLKSYYSLKKSVEKIDEKIDQIEYEMANVRGIQYDRIPGQSNEQNRTERMLILIEKKAVLEGDKLRIKELLGRLKKILVKELARLSDDTRNLLIRNAQGESLEKLAEEFGYTVSGLWRKLKKEVDDE